MLETPSERRERYIFRKRGIHSAQRQPNAKLIDSKNKAVRLAQEGRKQKQEEREAAAASLNTPVQRRVPRTPSSAFVNGGSFNSFHDGNVPGTAPPRMHSQHYMTPQQQQNNMLFDQASQTRASGNDLVLSLANTLQSGILNLADKSRQDTNAAFDKILSHVKEIPEDAHFDDSKESDDSLLPTPQKLHEKPSFSFGSPLTSTTTVSNGSLFNFGATSAAAVPAASNGNVAVPASTTGAPMFGSFGAPSSGNPFANFGATSAAAVPAASNGNVAVPASDAGDPPFASFLGAQPRNGNAPLFNFASAVPAAANANAAASSAVAGTSGNTAASSAGTSDVDMVESLSLDAQMQRDL